MELTPSEDTGKKKVDQGENFVRPFLKKGAGLSRFYKGKQSDDIIKTRKKLIPRRSQEQQQQQQEEDEEEKEKQQQHLKPNPPHHNNILSERTAKEENVRPNLNGVVHHDTGGQDVEEDDELKLFEALEKAAVTGSFCSTSSLAARFLKTKLDNYEKEKENSALKRRPPGKENDESIIVPSELYSPTTSLFIESDNDSDDDEDEDGVEQVEEEQGNNDQIKSNSENNHQNLEAIITSFASKSKVVSPPRSTRQPSSSVTAASSPLNKLEADNTSLKARIVYLEEKIEKNTLEWWSYKEQMIDIIHGLQNAMIRKDSHLESIQATFMQKIDKLQDEIRSQNQKSYENQIKMTQKMQELEEELEISHEKLTKVKSKMQKIIDTLQQNLHDKNVECAENHEIILNRVKSLESERKQTMRDLRKPHKKAPEPITEEAIRDSIQNMEDNIFGDDGEDGELGINKILPNGDKETLYSNGTRKLIAHDFSEMKHLYTNGDVRTVKRDGTVKYFYAESATWHTTYTNGVEYYEFANGQTERRNPNGIVEVVFPNGCVKYSHPSGTEECIFADNTILRVDSNGERAVVLPNGQQEIHGTDYKKRIYPDGTAKTVYNDGSQETRYPNGRIRIKDSQGVLLADISHNGKGKLSPRTTSSEKSLAEKS